MKDFLSLASRRQSDRAFDPQRPVEKEKLQRILEAACIAPSACNSQPWHFIVVDDPELKNRVADATSNRVLGMNHFTKQAPVHILVVEEKPNLTAGIGSWIKDKNFSHLDIGITAAHLVLAAEDEGWVVALSVGSMKRKFVNYWIFPPANASCWTLSSAIPLNRTDLRNAKIRKK